MTNPDQIVSCIICPACGEVTPADEWLFLPDALGCPACGHISRQPAIATPRESA